ncbi:MAG TPA: transposase [Verrucomicrobiota bacterium]|nr:chemotaxis protein CheW [Verrucomicrobiales bacterium]HRI12118.1 transposase [Verrucomicrobiota bacterium]
MRLPRLKAPEGHTVAYYHCLSRVVDRQFVLGEVEREQFVRLMREYEAFCGVRILTYCILSNHFHILIEVPERPKELPGSEELHRKLELLSGTALSAATARQRMEMFRQAGDAAGERAFWERICASMWDVSAFMKLLKQRFTQWFNRQKGRKGTLWEERFKSVLVEGAGEALSTMAAYIDLNPVRAGLVKDPKDYRWCGYAEAASGSRRAQRGLRAAIAGGERVAEAKNKLHEALVKYRVWLFGQGAEREGTTPAGQPLRKGFKREDVLAVVAARGRLAIPEYLRLKVRYFADGAILGTRDFVNRIFTALRPRFSAQRKDGARRMQGLDPELFTVRDLQVRVVE